MSFVPHFPKRLPEPKDMERIDLDSFEAHARKNYFRWFVPIVDDSLKRTALTKGCIVEIGSGPGFLVKEFASRSKRFTVFGIDRSTHALKLGKKNCRGLTNTFFKKGLADKIPLASGTVDLVVSKDSFHEFTNPLSVIREMLRVLKPGGTVYIQDLRRDIPFRILKEVMPPQTTLQKLQYYSTRASYTIPEMKKLLAKLKIGSYTLTTRKLTSALWKKYRGKIENREELVRALGTRFLLVIKKK
ncbi:class I SAM-dependent methyltransferase [Patescibacteria group bacterium]|nr:class I SAM-dependent methyltransferase [Patescibacteria group bacterium]